MRRIDPIDSTLTRSLDMIYEIDDAEMQTSASSEFPQKFNEAYANVIDADEKRRKRKNGPDFNEEEARVMPMRRKLYTKSEISQTIALDKLSIMALLDRAAHT